MAPITRGLPNGHDRAEISANGRRTENDFQEMDG